MKEREFYEIKIDVVSKSDEIISINQLKCPYLKKGNAKQHLINALENALKELKHEEI